MANAWVEHVRKFASKNGISYGCAVSDPECKAKYHRQKARNAKKTRTPAQEMEGMGAEDVNVAEKPKPKAPKAKAPSKVGKVIGVFQTVSTAGSDRTMVSYRFGRIPAVYAITDNNMLLQLLSDREKDEYKIEVLYKGDSVEDAWDYLKDMGYVTRKGVAVRRDPLAVDDQTASHNKLQKDTRGAGGIGREFLKKWGLKVADTTTENKMLFYGRDRSFGDRLTKEQKLANSRLPYLF